MNNRHSLDELFRAASQEVSPISEHDVATIITSAGSNTRISKTMMSMISMAAIVVAGLIVFATNPENANQSAITSSTTEVGPSARGFTVELAKETVDSIPNSLSNTWSMPNDSAPNADVVVSVLSVVADQLSRLNLNPSVVDHLRQSILNVDSLRYCERNAVTPTVCAWSNGQIKEFPLQKGNGPLPVMFTTLDGKGQWVAALDSLTIDINTLVPVETSLENGGMLLWYAPTTSLLERLPGEVARGLQSLEGRNHTASPDIGQVKTVGATRLQFSKGDLTPEQLNMMVSSSLDGVLRSSTNDGRVIAIGNNVQVLSDARQQMIDSMLKHMGVDTNRQRVMIRSFTFSDSLRFKLPEGVVPPADSITMTSGAGIFFIKQLGSSRKSSTGEASNLQALRSNEGALVVRSIHPNPVTDGTVNVAYDLRQDRTVTIEVLDLAGTTIVQPVKSTRKRQGLGQITFPVGSLSPGMYLLHMYTERGESVFQRLVIQR